MKDIEQLLKMTERPQDYTDEELQKLMSDPEMREYYELMVSAEAGFALRREESHEDRSCDSAGPNHRPMILSLGNRFIRIWWLGEILSPQLRRCEPQIRHSRLVRCNRRRQTQIASVPLRMQNCSRYSRNCLTIITSAWSIATSSRATSGSIPNGTQQPLSSRSSSC